MPTKKPRKKAWKPGPCSALRSKPNHWVWPDETADEVLGFIYRIDEIPTGRYYIGLKYVTPTSQAWQYYRGSSKPLHAAMDQYGYEAYRFTILFTCPSRSTLRMAEMDLQLAMDVIHDEDCYNLHIGGLQWASKSQHSAETKTKLKRSAKAYWETKRGRTAAVRYAASNTGEKHPQAKFVLVGTCKKTGKEIRYVGRKDLENDGFTHALVYKCIQGTQTHHKGYKWRKENAKPTTR